MTPINGNDLWLIETVTDGVAGAILRHTPVTIDETLDETRSRKYFGQTTVNGMIPLTFDLKALTLKAAIKEFPSALKIAVENFNTEARRRMIASAVTESLPRG